MSIAKLYWNQILSRHQAEGIDCPPEALAFAEQVLTETVEACATLLEMPATPVTLVRATAAVLRSFVANDTLNRIATCTEQTDAVIPLGGLFEAFVEQIADGADTAERIVATLDTAGNWRTTPEALEEAVAALRTGADLLAMIPDADVQSQLVSGSMSLGALVQRVLALPAAS